MLRIASVLLVGASFLAMAPAARAQSTPAAAAPEESSLAEIVVTARRRSESLQEVPQTVSAVTADTLQKLNIRQFQDIQTIVPGLSLQQNNSGYQSAASLRGVTFDVNTGAQPTVAMYLNDAPVQSLFLFQSLFDVGQIEVLRGPQGTTRGISAPSGAITLTTHKPNLSEGGGYLDGSFTDQGGRNVEGALNVPLIRDTLAMRIAAELDQNTADGVRSIHNSLRPRQVINAERVSLSYEPTDRLDVNVTYQHLDRSLSTFLQVSGPGNPALGNPPLTPEDRAAVQDGDSPVHQHFDVATAQIDSRIFGQHFSYVGSYQHLKVHNGGAVDTGNILPGVEPRGVLDTTQEQTTQEIRLASDPAPDRFFDYTVGAFYNWQQNTGHILNVGPLLPGAFGTAASSPDLAAFNPAYQIPIILDIPSDLQETSIFGSLTLHLGSKTELSGGVRHIWSIVTNQTLIHTGDGLINLGGVPCAALGARPGPNPGDCILPTAAVAGDFSNRTSKTPTIYNVSLSHHLTRDLLVYANTGSSFRPPVASVGIQGALAGSTDPALETLSFHPAETSTAYEVGFKATFLDGRARLNASAFRQKFTNLTIYIPGVTYLNTISTPPQPTNFDFTASVKALVKGFDIDSAFQITPEWNVALQASYADGKVENSEVPCNVTDAAGNPVFNTDGLISLCPGGAASRLPLWNASLQTEYVHQLNDRVEGFLRGLVTYYPQNKNRVQPDFTVNAYSLVNLYAGVRSPDGAWEFALFARNAFETKQTLDVQQVQLNINSALGTAFPQLIRPSGYFQTLITPRREVGVTLHYAWGSR